MSNTNKILFKADDKIELYTKDDGELLHTFSLKQDMCIKMFKRLILFRYELELSEIDVKVYRGGE